MICIGFDGKTIAPHVVSLLDRGVGAVVLFRRNVESPRQFAALCAELKRRAAHPLPIAIDQEGGRVMRLRGGGFTPVPSMRELGRSGDPELARQVGRLLARESRAVNVDWVLAPVLDVDTNPNNPVIADRSLGNHPQLVADLGCALIAGIQGAAVAACGKHFPGHGDTWQDSHLTLPVLDHDLHRLEQIELPPFQAAVRAGVASIMSAHVLLRKLDPHYPATMSRTILHGLLRDRLRFDGLLISDDMEMKAIASHYGIEQAIVLGTLAGIDLFAICHSADLQNQAIDILIRAVESGRVPMERIVQANRRLDALCRQYVAEPNDRPDLSVIGCEQHLAIAERVRRLSAAAPASTDPTEP
ncbi:MAG TPA: beta-N-acetylhexosaminidase [Tepidisphaeraceae bacterium]|nr:beta-N-acetylhexosaminidase [Tepidisphaeraceae bacterium]